MAEKISPISLYTLMVSMILSGAGLGIVLKLMDTAEAYDEPFEHPYFQCLIMFVGESLCIFIYLYQRQSLVREFGSVQASPGMKKAVQEGMKTDINPLLFAVPMLCDSTASCLLLIAYINVPASIAQMMGGFVVFIVAIFSIIFLKRKLYRHHWTGMVLIFIGIGLVALSALTGKSSDSSNKNPVLGISMMIGSILIQGCQYIVEEKLLGSCYLSPMKVVGWEGITGTIFWCIALWIFQFIPWDSAICSNGVIEDTRYAFQQMGENPEIIAYALWNVVLVAGMNGLGMAVTKYASAANRVTLQQSKTVIVWVFFLIVPIRGKETFKFLQLIGFIIMLWGVVLYNEILEIPFCGFNLYTKNGLAKTKLRTKSLNDELEEEINKTDMTDNSIDATDYTPTSPNRYDYQKNYKRLKHQMEDQAKGKKDGDYMKLEGIE